MKNLIKILFGILFLASSVTQAQSLGGFSLSDYLVSAVGPGCYDTDFITGPPDDSLWVNHDDYDTMTGTFGTIWADHPGDDLLLETGYNDDNYNVRLILSTGAYSTVHPVAEADWTAIASTNWYYMGSSCIMDSTISHNRFVLALDFITDFGLSPSDHVAGIEIVFLPTMGGPDMAGAYIIAPPCTTTFSQLSITECDEYTSPSGNFTWYTSGNYQDTIPNAGGCDSIIYVGLIITNTVDASIYLSTATTITANLSGATYQWLKCPDMTPIVGATAQSYTATENGDYALIVSDATCTDTSDCLFVGQVNLLETHFTKGLKVFPNPSHGEVNIKLNDHYEKVIISWLDLSGVTLHAEEKSGSSFRLECSLPEGVYFLRLEIENEVAIVKIALE